MTDFRKTRSSSSWLLRCHPRESAVCLASLAPALMVVTGAVAAVGFLTGQQSALVAWGVSTLALGVLSACLLLLVVPSSPLSPRFEGWLRSLELAAAPDPGSRLALSPESFGEVCARECSVCLGALAEPPCCTKDVELGDRAWCSSVLRLPCEHHFHGACAGGWLLRHASCPLCRCQVSGGLESCVVVVLEADGPRGAKRTSNKADDVTRAVDPGVHEL